MKHIIILVGLATFAAAEVKPNILLIFAGDIADRFGPDVLVEYVIAQMSDAKSAGNPFLILHNELLPIGRSSRRRTTASSSVRPACRISSITWTNSSVVCWTVWKISASAITLMSSSWAPMPPAGC